MGRTNISDFARKHGISRALVYRKLREGKSFAVIAEEARLRREAANSTHSIGRTRSLRPLTMPDSQGRPVTLYEARIRRTVAAADRLEMENAVRRGESAPFDEVNNWYSSAIIRCRDIVMGFVDLTEQVRRDPDEATARRLIEDECQRALAELEKGLQFRSSLAKA